MPLLGLRPADPDKDLRRRSTADALNLFRTKSKPASATISAEDMAGERDTEAAELGDQGPATAVARPSTPPSRNPPINTSLNGSLAPPSPPVQEETASHRRFSMLRFRHASDPQLSSNARGRPASPAPPLPSLPPGMFPPRAAVWLCIRTNKTVV